MIYTKFLLLNRAKTDSKAVAKPFDSWNILIQDYEERIL